MIIANETTVEYKGFTIHAVPMQTVWGYRIERDGAAVHQRPNGGLSAAEAEQLARDWIDEHAKMKATVESTHDDGSAETLRDEAGRRWRVTTNPGDGTLVIDRIDDYGGGPAIPTIDSLPSRQRAVATWNSDNSLSVEL